MSDAGRNWVCPSCFGDVDTETNLATAICQNCGLVLEELVDQTEVSEQEPEKNQSDESEEVTGRTVDWQEQLNLNDASDQPLIDALDKMDQAAAELYINTSLRARIAELLAKAWEQRVMYGRSQIVILGACILIECQSHGEARPLKAVAEVVDVEPEKIYNGRQAVRSELDLDPGTAHPRDFLTYLERETGVSEGVIEEAERILSNDNNVTGDPAGIAVAAVYLATESDNEDFTLVQAAEIVGLVKETIWKKADSLRTFQK